jgi:inner membrane protein
MYRKGHIGISIAVIGLTFAVLPVEVWYVIAPTIVVTERIPDNDHRIPIISHRGYSHTVLAGGVTGAILSAGAFAVGISVTGIEPIHVVPPSTTTETAVFGVAVAVFVGSICGITTHLLGDMITNGTGAFGVQPLRPVSDWECGIQLCRADNSFWNYVFLAGGICVFLLSALVKKAALTSGFFIVG